MACISVDWHDIPRDWHGAGYIKISYLYLLVDSSIRLYFTNKTIFVFKTLVD